MCCSDNTKERKRELGIKGRGSGVKALTNFPRCWERPASNHPEEAAGQLETTFREKWEESSNCGHQSTTLVATSLQKASVNTSVKRLQYHTIQKLMI